MQAAMSCETLVCKGSQTANRHKPIKYYCPGKQNTLRSNPCPPQGLNKLSTRPCLGRQGLRTNIAQTSRANACKGRQATGRSLPDYAGCSSQMTTRSKPKVNCNIDSSRNRESLKEYII